MFGVVQVVKQEHGAFHLAEKSILLFDSGHGTVHPFPAIGVGVAGGEAWGDPGVHAFRFESRAEALTNHKIAKEARAVHPEVGVECPTLLYGF